MEESKHEIGVVDPTSPDIDNMTYEQLMELGENAGKVNTGLSQQQIDQIRAFTWIEGRTKQDTCTICMEKFKIGAKYKKLLCNHEYHSECVNEWLLRAKKCPVCSSEAI